MIEYENITQFSQIFSSEFFVFAFVASLINVAIAIVIARKFMQIMQSCGYVKTEYAKWTYRRDNIYISRLFMMVLLSLMAYMLFTIVFSFPLTKWSPFVAFIFYFIFAIIYISADFKRKSKARLVLTTRMIRLNLTFGVVFLLITYALIVIMQIAGYLLRENTYFIVIRFSIICLTPMLIPPIVEFSNFLNGPFEKSNNKKYITFAKNKIEGSKHLIKIGITGSYGKTSVKEILKTILSVKYKVLATPASYNTPMGICKSVKRLDDTYDVFIAEMGARHVGDIKEVADIVKPDYAIITGVINQHLETFGTLEAIMETKYELIDSLKEGSYAIFATDTPNTYKMSQKARTENRVKVINAGTDLNCLPSVYATNIKNLPTESTFTLNIKSESVFVTTSLIGKHNVSNICVASAIAYALGMTKEEIAEGISLVKPIRHRLEVMTNQRGMIIIDDSYNSNVDGTIVALEVFKNFDGRKIIITPGLVELGKMEDVENFRLGRRIASVVDYAILVGSPNAYKIRDGLLEGGFDFDKFCIVQNLTEAVKKLNEISKEGDVVLFENDLPDKFM